MKQDPSNQKDRDHTTDDQPEQQNRRELLKRAGYKAPLLLGVVDMTKQSAFALSHPRRYDRGR